MRNLLPILALAMFGAVYSTVVSSIIMFVATRWVYPTFSLIDCLVFGSMISSTDPVSVLGLLPPSTDRNLYMLIFGESALNDAVSIILYRFFTELAANENSNGSITFSQFFSSIAHSVWVFFGSVVVGVVVALCFAKLTKHVKPPELPIFELVMFLVFAYCSYLLAEILEFTGIISVFFCGATMAHYAYDNMSKVTILTSKVRMPPISSLTNFTHSIRWYCEPFRLCAIVLCFSTLVLGLPRLARVRQLTILDLLPSHWYCVNFERDVTATSRLPF